MRNLVGLTICAFILFSSASMAFTQSEQFSDYELKDLQSDQQGFIQNTSGDGFLVLNNIDLNRAEMCGLSMIMEFKEPPFRATVFDLYWRTAQTGFSESQKGFFIVNEKDARFKNSYAIPLCKLYNFSGNLNQPQNQANITSFRIDFPPNKTVAVRFETIRFVDSFALSQLMSIDEGVVLEPYESVSGRSFTSLDVIVPKLIFAFEEGVKRFVSDVPFLIFWLLLIVILKGLMLWSYMRQFGSKSSENND